MGTIIVSARTCKENESQLAWLLCVCVSVLVRSTDYGRMMSRSQILYGQNLHPKPNQIFLYLSFLKEK